MKDLSKNSHYQKRLAHSAKCYLAHSKEVRQIGDILFERMDFIKHEPKKILDLGGGDGYFAERLKKRFPKADITNLDLSLARLGEQPQSGLFKKAPYQSVCADMQQLPFTKDSFDMVFANLSFQACDIDRCFAEISRVLEDGGMLLFSMFGPDTFIELRQAFRAIDETPHINVFPDMHDVGDRLLAAQLQGPVMDVERLHLKFDSVDALIKKLAHWGERNHHEDRSKHLITPGKWQKMLDAYPKNDDGRISVGFEIVFGHAWGRTITQSVDSSGAVLVSIDSLREQLRKP